MANMMSGGNPTASWCTLSKVCANKSLRLTCGRWKKHFVASPAEGEKNILSPHLRKVKKTFCRLTCGRWKKHFVASPAKGEKNILSSHLRKVKKTFCRLTCGGWKSKLQWKGRSFL